MIDFDGLLFDLDGTLLDTAPDFITSVNAQLAMHGQAQLPHEEIRLNVTNGSAGLIQHAFGISKEDPTFEEYKNELLSIYRHHLADKTVFFPGLLEVLHECKNRAIPWGIVTNKPWAFTKPLLAELHLLEFSACTVCPDHVKKPKPDPESINLACDLMHVNPERCIYIGDHARDITAGKNAGMRTIAAHWGYVDNTEDISKWGATWIVKKSQLLRSFLFGTTEC